jgi:hypothetical protein
MSHDQNFKNLILDYPREALAFFAESEAADLPPEIRITPVRQEQLQGRLGERFRELDTPLLLEWPDGRRAALLFVIEEESDPRRFSIHRLIHYCADLSELCETDRVVPVVIFLRGGPDRRSLELRSDRHTYLSFTFISCELGGMHYRRHRDSTNIVARLNLPNMRYAPEERVDVYAAAVRGLSTLEPDPERQLKYADFIDIYSALDENERARYEAQYPAEAKTVSSYFQQARQQGRQEGRLEGRQEGRRDGRREGRREGRQEGRQEGEALVLLRLLRLKFGEIDEESRRRIEAADAETLLVWSERILTAGCIEDVIR